MGKSRSVTTAGKTLVRLLWLDFFCIALVSLAMGGLYLVPPHRRGERLFPLWLSTPTTTSCGAGRPDGRIVGPRDISYPYGKEILTSVHAAVACLLVPIAVLLGVQVWLRSVWDASAGVLGLLKALVAATFTQVILKQYIGGFRPHFLDVCRPDIGTALPTGFGAMYFNVSTCRGRSGFSPKERDRSITYALQSFPSGHTAAAFSVGLFLSLYLNAKLKAFADYSAEFWSFVVVIAPVIGASIIGGGLLIDNHHHPTDVLFGALIGSICALLAYRSSYASLLDYRYNHIPLPPQAARTRFDYENLDLASADSLVLSRWWRQRNTGTTGWRQEEGRLFDSVRKVRERGRISTLVMSNMTGGDGTVEGGEVRTMAVLSPVAVVDITPG